MLCSTKMKSRTSTVCSCKETIEFSANCLQFPGHYNMTVSSQDGIKGCSLLLFLAYI